ncbi:MAG TPA: choice-of-anchor tandem repeat GloVer-containing protein, partial [Chitinophagales bacterium]|nr:choice-of-anchor tandem repeat GloVer-containing protein [Chitinophagales bacterium]
MRTLLLSIIICLSFQITSAQTPELWGMISHGGIQDYGTVFKINADGTDFWKLHDFTVKNPGMGPRNMTPLVYDGWLYGVTSGGGLGYGVLFKYHPGENRYVPIHFFSIEEGMYPSGSLMLASNGKMYGVTQNGGNYDWGTLYEFDPVSEQVFVKFNFAYLAGNHPNGKLVEKDGYLYGVTQAGSSNYYYGELYRFSLSSGTYEILHHFSGTEGSSPTCDLLLASDGKFYGETLYGGNYYSGTLFCFDPSNNSFSVLHDFSGISDAFYPEGNLIEYAPGKIAGTVASGGTYGGGIIFTYDYMTAQFEIYHHFGGPGDLLASSAPLIMQRADGWIYGTTTYYFYGDIVPSVFRFYPDSAEPQLMAQFTPQDFNSYFSSPVSGLADFSDGWLYSCTGGGGLSAAGTLYRFNPDSFKLEKLIDLNENNCVHPFGSLTVSQNGKLYGIGGRDSYYNPDSFSINHPIPTSTQYSMFEINPLTGTFKRVAPEIPGGFGDHGVNSLTAASDQKVYGIRADGLQVFRYDPANDTSEVFQGDYFLWMTGDMIQATNNKL